jgi:hypothetical protein
MKIKRIVLVWMLSMISVVGVNAQNILTGEVKNERGIRIANVKVVVGGSFGLTEGDDTNTYFNLKNIELPTEGNPVEIEFSHPEYERYRGKIYLVDGGGQKLKFRGVDGNAKLTNQE